VDEEEEREDESSSNSTSERELGKNIMEKINFGPSRNEITMKKAL
jgi:hypothetical protein